MYSSKVMEHFMMPRNVWYMPNADGVGCVCDPQCGDKLTVFVRIGDEVIRNASFVVFGCGAAIATGSQTTMLAKGKTIKDALRITELEIIETLEGLPEDKRHCCELSVSALQAAILDYLSKQGKTIKEYL